MQFVGVDLHKKTISVCVVVQEGGKRRVGKRRTIACAKGALSRGLWSSH